MSESSREQGAGKAIYAERIGGAEWVSTGGLAKLAGVSSAYIRQLRAAGKLPEPESLMDDGSRTLPLWSAASAEAWAKSR
ncbi:hypothetical protein E4U03_04695 [Rothia nasimurium]|uniref:DNA-binding protein n=1 Tax=Rothia nasimurium TaxID=85336 RepID=A0A4Y9F618_9MICC|nr:hypothetical protein [Rothia nasimurium]MBF0807916.1 hypothetical protein [Rothia nasimurium]TFU22918.1 hypothetical protein E4U03_04695 [Rothia nasimurium]